MLQEITNKEEVLWAKCIDINNNWNVEVALARDERLVIEREAERELILTELIEKEEEKKKNLEAIEEIVRLEKVYMHIQLMKCLIVIILKFILF